jgi:hypothetical protein
MQVIIIREDNHGQIGVATTYKAALQWLIKSAWVGCFTDVSLCEEGKWVYKPIEELAKSFGYDDWKEFLFEILSQSTDDFCDLLDSMGFYFSEDELHEEEVT